MKIKVSNPVSPSFKLDLVKPTQWGGNQFIKQVPPEIETKIMKMSVDVSPAERFADLQRQQIVRDGQIRSPAATKYFSEPGGYAADFRNAGYSDELASEIKLWDASGEYIGPKKNESMWQWINQDGKPLQGWRKTLRDETIEMFNRTPNSQTFFKKLDELKRKIFMNANYKLISDVGLSLKGRTGAPMGNFNQKKRLAGYRLAKGDKIY